MTGKSLNWLRLEYRRSFRRANVRQLRRFVGNLVRRPPARHPRKFLSVGLTHRCQYSCDWCATALYRKNAAQEFTTEEVERLLTAISRSRFVFDHVSLLGGECLLRADVFQLVRYAARLGLFVHVSSNGLKLNDECAKRLAAAGLNSAFISLPVEPPRTERDLRVRETALAAMRACARVDLPCFASLCVVRETVYSGDLERAVGLARQNGAVGARLMPVRLAGKWLWQGTDKVLTPEEEWKVRSLCADGYSFISDDFSRDLGLKCPSADRRIVYVSPYGDIHPCHFFPYVFGNVRTAELDGVLDRMWAHDMFRSDGYACFLQEQDFRSRYVQTLAPGTPLPVKI